MRLREAYEALKEEGVWEKLAAIPIPGLSLGSITKATKALMAGKRSVRAVRLGTPATTGTNLLMKPRAKPVSRTMKPTKSTGELLGKSSELVEMIQKAAASDVFSATRKLLRSGTQIPARLKPMRIKPIQPIKPMTQSMAKGLTQKVSSDPVDAFWVKFQQAVAV